MTVGDSVAYGFADYLKDNGLVYETLLTNRARSSTLAEQAQNQVSDPKTGEWLARLERDLPHASLVVVITGTNDLHSKPPDAIARNVKRFVDALKPSLQVRQDLRIAFVTPTRKEDVGKPDNGELNSYKTTIEDFFKRTDSGPAIKEFVCLSREEVGLKGEDFEDNLHPNEQGYSKIAQALVKKFPRISTPPSNGKQVASSSTPLTAAAHAGATVNMIQKEMYKKETDSRKIAADAMAAKNTARIAQQARLAGAREEEKIQDQLQDLKKQLDATQKQLDATQAKNKRLAEEAKTSNTKWQKLDEQSKKAKHEVAENNTKFEECKKLLSHLVPGCPQL